MLPKISLNIILLACFLYSNAQTLDQNFKNPPASAKPQTWFHVISGNMSREGLTKDLEAISSAGGTVFFNVAQGVPLANVTFNSSEQHQLLKHAAAESERLGLTFGFHNCDGWSSSGGPWVNAENSMKMVVYSQTIVAGAQNTTVKLPQPTVREGFYRDIAVLAYLAFPTEVLDSEIKPVAPHALKYVEIDSYEVGSQDWTKGFETIFKTKYMYDIVPFLPLFAGRFVESADASEAVTDDLRNLFSQLMCGNYFGYFQELMNKDGIQAINEPYGNGPFNEMDAGKYADMPMGEFWLNRGVYLVGPAVSSGHIYGKQKISTESFTAVSGVANWNMHPAQPVLNLRLS